MNLETENYKLRAMSQRSSRDPSDFDGLRNEIGKGSPNRMLLQLKDETINHLQH